MNASVKTISDALDGAGKCKIAIVGDFCLDKYLYIDPIRDEVSVETNLPAYQVHSKAHFAGVGGTITNNLRSLGTQVFCVGLVGDDGEGYDLIKSLHRVGADTKYLVKTDELCTSTYMKPMRKKDGRYVETNRYDFRNFVETPENLENEIIANFIAAAAVSDAVIVTDQYLHENFSSVTNNVRNAVCKMAKEQPTKIIYADSRGFAERYHDVIIKCNNLEAMSLMKPDENDKNSFEALSECAAELAERNNNKAVIITRGEQPTVMYVNKKFGALNKPAHELPSSQRQRAGITSVPTFMTGTSSAPTFKTGISSVPTFKVDGDIDITGAGDAANAGIVLGLCLGLPLWEAVLLGNCVSSITIRQIGVTGTSDVDGVRRVLSRIDGQI